MVSVCKNPATEYECVDKVKCVSNEYKCDGLPDCDDESDESPVMCKFLFLKYLSFYFKECKNDLNDSVKCHIVDIYVAE